MESHEELKFTTGIDFKNKYPNYEFYYPAYCYEDSYVKSYTLLDGSKIKDGEYIKKTNEDILNYSDNEIKQILYLKDNVYNFYDINYLHKNLEIGGDVNTYIFNKVKKIIIPDECLILKSITKGTYFSNRIIISQETFDITDIQFYNNNDNLIKILIETPNLLKNFNNKIKSLDNINKKEVYSKILDKKKYYYDESDNIFKYITFNDIITLNLYFHINLSYFVKVLFEKKDNYFNNIYSYNIDNKENISFILEKIFENSTQFYNDSQEKKDIVYYHKICDNDSLILYPLYNCENFNPSKINNYKELCIISIDKNPFNIFKIQENLRNNFFTHSVISNITNTIIEYYTNYNNNNNLSINDIFTSRYNFCYEWLFSVMKEEDVLHFSKKIVHKYPYIIKCISKIILDDEIITNAITIKPEIINILPREYKMLTNKYCKLALKLEPKIIYSTFDTFYENIEYKYENLLYVTEINPEIIFHLYEHTSELPEHILDNIRNKAIELNGLLLEKIKNPTEQQCLLAIKSNYEAHNFIPSDIINSSEEIQDILISNDPFLLRIIKNPSKNISNKAISLMKNNYKIN